MSNPIDITSATQFDQLLNSSRTVVANFYSESNGPSSQIAPIYDQLSGAISRKNLITFVKINTQTQKDITSAYNITTLPTFVILRNGKVADKIQGANPVKLSAAIKKLVTEAENAGESSGTGTGSSGPDGWRGADLPRGYSDVTDQIESRRCELLNYDSQISDVKVLFEKKQPAALSPGKAAAVANDWIESDTDEQLLLFMPFMSMVKLHTIQITSLPPSADDDDEAPMRPKLIKLFTNKPHNLGFDEAEDMTATQTIELTEKDWNAVGTANIPLRFVKFQNINSLVLFVMNGDGSNDSEKVRIDRIRLIGEAGAKREMGKLEKIGDEAGE
ncbi:PITH domain-containing protein [Rhypophila decipiens]|uniref:PITH domain-containing protein n=1 Tax=Rhypophila decipiens TaxID=261697 RepID=A0AAN6YE80_9PEZI|nr:PITH domain-containing protein [Rhypophila decipiens]